MHGNDAVRELLLQAIETEQGGQKIYTAAIKCASTPDLKEEWTKYLEETTEHEAILREAFGKLGLDPEETSPGRMIVREKAAGLVAAMDKARATMPGSAPQLVAAECVVEAETKDHGNWELIGKLAEESKLSKDERQALKEAYEQVEEQEDEHLYHTMGWARELWLEALGMPAVIPPPEEQKSVKSAIGAARAKNARAEMLT